MTRNPYESPVAAITNITAWGAHTADTYCLLVPKAEPKMQARAGHGHPEAPLLVCGRPSPACVLLGSSLHACLCPVRTLVTLDQCYPSDPISPSYIFKTRSPQMVTLRLGCQPMNLGPWLSPEQPVAHLPYSRDFPVKGEERSGIREFSPASPPGSSGC